MTERNDRYRPATHDGVVAAISSLDARLVPELERIRAAIEDLQEQQRQASDTQDRRTIASLDRLREIERGIWFALLLIAGIIGILLWR
jgi:hypothetical protein